MERFAIHISNQVDQGKMLIKNAMKETLLGTYKLRIPASITYRIYT